MKIISRYFIYVILVAALLIIGTLLTACDQQAIKTYIDIHAVTYQYDDRSDLCFAIAGQAKGESLGMKTSAFSMTNVPCTEKVKTLIGR